MKYPKFYGSSNVLSVCFFVLGMFFTNLQFSYAQRPSPSVGIGFQAGDPTGLSLQFYRNHGMSTDILFAYHFDHFFFLNIHGLWNTHLDDSGHFHFFYGPGGFIGVRTFRSELRDDEVAAGISGNLGLSLVLSRLELFGQVTPRLEVTPNTDLNIGGGVGMRFYF